MSRIEISPLVGAHRNTVGRWIRAGQAGGRPGLSCTGAWGGTADPDGGLVSATMGLDAAEADLTGYECNEAAVRRWMEEQYDESQARARQEGRSPVRRLKGTVEKGNVICPTLIPMKRSIAISGHWSAASRMPETKGD